VAIYIVPLGNVAFLGQADGFFGDAMKEKGRRAKMIRVTVEISEGALTQQVLTTARPSGRC